MIAEDKGNNEALEWMVHVANNSGSCFDTPNGLKRQRSPGYMVSDSRSDSVLSTVFL